MQPETIEQPTPAPGGENKPAIIPPAVAPPSERNPRVTADMLVSLAPSERRDNWIAQLVEVEVARQTYSQDKALARDFAMSGQFDDLKGVTAEQAIATAMVKIQLGRAWGFNAADSMRYIYFTNGRPATENEIIATKLQQGGFNWDIEWLEETVPHKSKPWKRCIGCTLWIKKWNADARRYDPLLDRNQQPVSVSFTEGDADHAMIWEKGKQVPLSEKWNFKSWGRDMYFWRTIGRVKKYYAPHVMRGMLSREEALEMIPVENMPPEMLPKELQPPMPEPQPPEAASERKRPSLKSQLMGTGSVVDVPAQAVEEPQQQNPLEGVDGA
jgi:hypothetical protein